MVKTPHLECKGYGLIPGWGNKISHALLSKKKKDYLIHLLSLNNLYSIVKN